MITSRKSSEAVPITRGHAYRRGLKQSEPTQAWLWLLGAGLIGAVAGIGSIAMAPDGLAAIQSRTKPMAVAMGIVRARSPQPGDYWQGCDSVRAAGTAPIYSGEPGYRPEMDGDGDGVACEPYH